MVSPNISEAISGATADVAMHWQDQSLAPRPVANEQETGQQAFCPTDYAKGHPWLSVGAALAAGVLISFILPRH